MLSKFVPLLLLVPGLTLADPLPPECAKSSVKSIPVPVRAGNPAATFDLRFEEHVINPALPTILFVPSGPGNRNIFPDREDYAKDYFLPSGVNRIGLEYRGVGCNAGARKALKDEDYTLTAAADDFIEVIRQRKLQRYFLFGVGNGSAVARIMASRAMRAGIPEPQSVIYTAAVSHAWKKKDRFKAGVIEEWEELKKEMTPGQLALLRGKNTFFNGFSRKAWGNYIVNSIWAGWTHPVSGGERKHELIDAIEALATNNRAAIGEILAKVRKFEKDPRVMAVDNPFSRFTLCQELTQTDDEEIELNEGKLRILGGAKFCSGLKLHAPYDAARWPVGVNQYVIQGARDPFMRPEQIHGLLEASPNVHTSVLWGDESGHGLTVFSLQPCRERLWAQILEHRPFSMKTLTECSAPLSVDQRRQD